MRRALATSEAQRRDSGFTILELLVAIAIVGVLASLIIPAVGQARASAQRIQCSNNLRQFFIAVGAYESTHQMFPPEASRFGASTQVILLPFVDQRPLYGVRSIQFHVFTRHLQLDDYKSACEFGVTLES